MAGFDPWKGCEITGLAVDVGQRTPSWCWTPARVAEHRIIHVLGGSGWFACDGVRLDAQPGDVFAVRRRQRLEGRKDPESGLNLFVVQFNVAAAGGGDPFAALDLPVRLRAPPRAAAPLRHALIDLLVATGERGPRAALERRAGLLRVCAEAASLVDLLPPSAASVRQRPTSWREDPAVSAQQYIDDRFREQLSMAAVARRFGFGRGRFAARFRELTGFTPTAYLRDRRIVHARFLLETTAEPIAKVAAAVGFPDPFYFSRVFSAAVGRSPEAYRREVRA